MFSLGATYLLYNFMLIACPLLCYLSEKRNNRGGIYLAYVIIFAASALRFDIGFDYENYYYIFSSLANKFNYNGAFDWIDLITIEPFAFIFGYLFQWSANAYLYVIATYSLITIILLFKIFDHYNIHTIGIFLYLASWIMFQSWDWVRQALALSFFLYSIQYIESKSFLKFSVCIFLATMSHYSALVLILAYPLSKLHIQRQFAIGIAVIALLLSLAGVLDQLKSLMFSLIPYYAELYANTDYETAGGNHSSTTLFLTAILYLIYIAVIDKKYNYLQIPFLTGYIIFLISADNLNLDRIAWYFTSLQLIIVPLSLREALPGTQKRIVLLSAFGLLFLIYNVIDIGATIRGCTPYETIFSPNCEQLHFRDREPINWLN